MVEHDGARWRKMVLDWCIVVHNGTRSYYVFVEGWCMVRLFWVMSDAADSAKRYKMLWDGVAWCSILQDGADWYAIEPDNENVEQLSTMMRNDANGAE